MAGASSIEDEGDEEGDEEGDDDEDGNGDTAARLIVRGRRAVTEHVAQLRGRESSGCGWWLETRSMEEAEAQSTHHTASNTQVHQSTAVAQQARKSTKLHSRERARGARRACGKGSREMARGSAAQAHVVWSAEAGAFFTPVKRLWGMILWGTICWGMLVACWFLLVVFEGRGSGLGGCLGICALRCWEMGGLVREGATM